LLTYFNNKNVIKCFHKNKITGKNSINLDITKKIVMTKQLKKINVILHLASLDHIESKLNKKESHKVHILGTKNLLELSKKIKIKKFIYFSTINVYGKNLKKEVFEKTNTHPTNNYSRAKLIAENIIYKYSLNSKTEFIILRLSNIISEPKYLRDNFRNLLLNEICFQLLNHNSIKLFSDGKQTRDFVSIKDLAFFTKNLIKKKIKKNFEILNFCSGKNISIKKFTNLVIKRYEILYNKKPKITFGSKVNQLKYKISNVKIKKMKLIKKFSSYIDHIDATLRFCNKFINGK
jgi:nucleoside-diphosphate-sugar epimerase